MRDDDDALTSPEIREVDSVGPTLGEGGSRRPVYRSSIARYRLGELIGRGGMGEIVTAKDDQIGRSVAIKRMRGTSAEARTRFLREARIQGRLEHPAVVPVHELATDDDGEPYFVMKHLAGTTLHDVIVKLAEGDAEIGQRFPRQRLLRAFADICLAIEFAHTRGVIHRDLKPANLMLGDFGEVYIIDWGIARIVSDTAESFADIDSVDPTQTLAGAVVGTPGYMSPEQARIDDTDTIDGRSDVYALGCILFEILALQPMHKRGLGGLSAALAGDQTAPSVRAPELEIPPELDAICIKATMFAAADRHATARELGDAVQSFLDGDRDVVLRKKLAADELAKAREALTRGNDVSARRDAIRAAGRALALEPTDRAAAALVARLMLEPPAELPPEAEREIADREHETLHAARRLVSGSAIASCGFFPLLLWAGFRNPFYITTGVVAVAVIGLTSWLAPRSWTVAVGRIAFVGWTVLLALLAYMLSPFLLAVGVIGIVGTGVAMHPAIIHRGLLFVTLSIAALAPWLLGPDSLSVTGHDIIIHAATDWLDPLAVRVGLAIFVMSTTLTAVILAGGLSDDRRAVQRRLEIQAWQLRQLVPEPTT
jgi:serine/threonine-protein kinase